MRVGFLGGQHQRQQVCRHVWGGVPVLQRSDTFGQKVAPGRKFSYNLGVQSSQRAPLLADERKHRLQRLLLRLEALRLRHPEHP
jgi:hypothetical protein